MRRLLLFLSLAFAAAAASGGASAAEPTLKTVASGLVHPWGLAFLPDGRLLVTERDGRLRIVDGAGKLSAPVDGLPAIEVVGQGGLLDVALDPQFATTGLVYLSFAEPRDGGNGTSLLRGRLVFDGDKARLDGATVIFRQLPALASGHHFGGRIVFSADGHLFLTLGERNKKPMAQRLDNHYGKVVRLMPDGAVPADNPFVGKDGALPEIWSYGHRNPQGASLDPATGRLVTVEHGARGGDEINRPEAGKNYGWPVITYGRDYSGAKIGEGTEKAGMEQPVHYWDPSIAPSGLAFYTSDKVPEWKGSLFVGALAGEHLQRLKFDGDKLVEQEKLLTDLGERIRDVRPGPDGALWLLTDSPDGRVMRYGVE